MKEKVSALMDGELDERAAGEAIQAMRGEGEALEAWRTYHLISDAMRDTRLLRAGFVGRVSERLAAEPTVLAPAPTARPAQRFALAAAASVAAVALVGWLAFAPQADSPLASAPLAQTEPPLAQATGPVIAAKPAVVVQVPSVPLSSRANDYLLAHQGFSPRLSLQGMAPYVRLVADRPDEHGK